MSVNESMETITKLQEEVLIGSLLGDGHLEKHKNGKNASLKIGRATSDRAYLEWQAIVFKNYLTPSGIIDRKIFDKRTKKVYKNSRLSTSCSPVFTIFHSKWYKEKTKIVPSDLVLTPLILAVWIADDGHVSCYKCRKKKNASYGKEYPEVLHIKIATHGFTENECKFLLDKIEKLCSVKGHLNKEKNGQATLRFYKEDAIKILRVIDSVFPPLERKSMIWKRDSAKLWENDKIYVCPHCKSEKVYKNGKNTNNKQKYHCQSCKKQFIQPVLVKEKIL